MNNNADASSQQLNFFCKNDNMSRSRKEHRKSKVSEKEFNVRKCISRRRTATFRSDGRYQVSAKVNGKVKICYGLTEYKANCKADIAEADDELRDILTTEKRYQFGYTYLRWRNYLLFYSNLTHETVDRYENTYNRYFYGTSFDRLNICKIASRDVLQFINNILQEHERLTNKEYQRIRHLIKAVIDFLYDEELDDTDVQVSLDWDRIKRKIPRGKIYTPVKREYAMSQTVKNDLKAGVIDECIYPEKYAATLLLVANMGLGLRIGELAALTIHDIDMKNRIVYVNKSCKTYKQRDDYGNATGRYEYIVDTTKTPKGVRYVPMSDTVYQILNELLQYRKDKGYKSNYLAYDGERSTLKTRTHNMIVTWERLQRKLNIEPCNTHVIRKTFATSLSKSPDIDIATISEYMGHAQVSTTLNNYIIPEKESIETQIQKISKYV